MTDEREEQSHRLNNRKKSNATKNAWKTHHYNYMKGMRKKSRENMNSFLDIAKELKENIDLLESKIEKDDIFNYKGDILFDNIAGGISFSIDKKTGEVSFSTYLSDEGGKGNYKQVNGGTSNEELEVLYNNLKDDLLTLSNTVDDSLKQILAKYGLRETA